MSGDRGDSGWEGGGIDALRSEVKGLRELVRDLTGEIRGLREKLEHADRRHNDSCRSCTAWSRISAMEQSFAEMRGTAKGWALGAAGVAGAISFIAGLIINH